jgi:serine protease
MLEFNRQQRFAETLDTNAQPSGLLGTLETPLSDPQQQTISASSLDRTPAPAAINTRILAGSLRADTFTTSLSDRLTVVSGNGNVDFGLGLFDTLNLSNISVQQVSINWASQSGGLVFNAGHGNQVFDAISFSTGQSILFEGIEKVQFAEGVIDLTVQPNDPLFDQQWNLHMMGVHTAWRFTTGSENVMVGVQDTGLTIDFSGFLHPETNETLWFGGQVIDDERNNHGTEVQGIISAKTNNGLGMSGINWNSDVINIDVLGEEVGDLEISAATQVMINQARSLGKRLVINMSLSMDARDPDLSLLEFAIQNNPDVLFVIAAGNNGHLGQAGIANPAVFAQNYGNVIAVGASWGSHAWGGQATNPGDRINYAGWWGSQYGFGLTLMGPSEVVAPTFEQGQFNYTDRFNGTSAATPNVTGVASLVLSANGNLSAAQVKQILSETAVDVGFVGYDIYTGHGFVNADSAVRRSMAIARGYA